MDTILRIEDLHKFYGRIKALQGLSLEVTKGNIFGILGPNGSGKTTTLGIVLDIINKTKGNYFWFDEPSSKYNRRRIGAILETPAFYPYLSAVQNLKIAAKIKKAPFTQIEKVLDMVDLYDRKNDQYRTYSLGMKQRLAIAAALIADPDVMILDEPTNGLDPQGIKEVRDIIIRIGQLNKTIILASHLLVEVQKVCSHFAVLNKGRKIYQGTVAEALGGKPVFEVSSENNEYLKSIVSDFSFVDDVKEEPDCLVISLSDPKSGSDLNKALFEKGIILSHLNIRKKDLENQFLTILSQSHE